MDYSAGLYIRLSKEDENEGQSESVTNQLSLLTSYAKEHNFPVFDTYIDDGWSGTTFDRPAFRRLIDDIELKHVNMVITKDLSRLGRDYILTGHYMERYFPENRVRYISILDGIDTGVESTANDITPFRALLNDLYAKDISKKIKSVKHDKQRKGLFIGGKPLYGYKKSEEKNKIAIDDVAAPLVRRIFGMALSGLSCRQIASQLNAEGIPSPALYAGVALGRRGPYCGMWSSERISDMLQNETYIGNMVQGRSAKLSYKSKRCMRQPRENWIVVEDTHEPIIGKDAFEKVQLLLKSRKTTRSRTYDYLLKGLIYCHECGYPLAVINRKNSKGEDCLYFVCRTYQRFTKAGVCTCHSIKAETVTQAVIRKVREVCENDLRAEMLLSEAKKAVEEALQTRGREQEAKALMTKKESLTALLDKIYMDRLSGILDEHDFERIYRRTKLERTALEKTLTELAAPDYKPEKQDELPIELANRFIESAWSNRELLVSLIKRIELTEDKQILIHFRFRQPETIAQRASLTIGDTNSIPY
ncbi:hypothetical protein SDC9_81628 [bioreactor metagenome]|uniref:Uncharacterized protein n=1 Tax=bioreactor metagenome TaxID=1076179 RepID=A0A644Z440_9ZZZZ